MQNEVNLMEIIWKYLINIHNILLFYPGTPFLKFCHEHLCQEKTYIQSYL